MKIFFGIGLYLLLLAGSSSAQSVWKQLHGPYLGVIQQIEITENNTVYTLTNTGRLLRSNNNTWQEIALPMKVFYGTYVYCSIAVMENTLFAFNNTPEAGQSKVTNGLYRSVDQGKNWTQVLQNTDLSAIHQCKRSGKLYAFRGGQKSSITTIFRSIDSGIHWDSLTSIPLTSFDFLVDDSDRCYFSLSQTPLGAVRYDPKTNLYKALISEIETPTQHRPYMTFCNAKIYVRSCCGLYELKADESWSKRSDLRMFPYGNGMPTMVFKPFISSRNGDLYTVALKTDVYGDFLIYRSTDFGITWKSIESTPEGVNVDYVPLALDSAGEIYLGSGHGKGVGLFSSADNGQSWEHRGIPIGTLSVLQEGPGNSLIAKESTNGDFYLSFDNGGHWEKTTTFFNLPTTLGRFVPSSFGCYYFDLVHDTLNIWFAETGSTSFEKRNSLASIKSFPKTAFDATGFYLLFDLPNNQLLKSTDLGVTWQQMQMPSDDHATTIYSDTSSLYLGFLGIGQKIYRSDDGGIQWKMIIDNSIFGSFLFIRTVKPNTLLLSTTTGLWRSNDGGPLLPWDAPFSDIRYMEVLNNTCFIVSPSAIASCKINTNSWSTEAIIDGYNYPTQALLLKDRFYVSLLNNGIWHTTSGITTVNSKPVISDTIFTIEHIDASGLSLQVSLKDHSHLTVSIYDILGQKIKTIAVGEFGEGKHNIVVETSSLASGVYYFVLKTPKTSFAQKCLISH